MKADNQLPLDRCPHCGIAKPTIARVWGQQSSNHSGENVRSWYVYNCSSCGGAILTVAPQQQGPLAEILQMWPDAQSVPEALPPRAKEYFEQALGSISAPAGAVMLMASAIDSMLKDKNLKDGSLNARINQAAKDHMITQEMAEWAHEIRLDANDQRHADETAPMPSDVDAGRIIDFGKALAQFLYVLPAKVASGRGAPQA